MNIRQNSKKFPASCPNIIKFYSNGMDDVDIIDKKNSCLQTCWKSKHCFYLNMFLIPLMSHM